MIGRSPPQKPRPSTPPQTPGSIVSPLRHTESEPNIATMMELNTERKKRKHDGEDNSMSSMSDTLREMFAAFTLEQSKNFNSLLSAVITIKEQNFELTKSVEMISTKYDEFLARITV